MPRKIPKKDFLDQLMRYIIRKQRVIDSQKKFAYLVKKTLGQYDNRFAITPSRLRQLATKIPEIKIRTQTRQSKEKKKLTICPVCRKKLSKKEEVNLIGKKVNIGYRCSKCGFKSDLTSLIPRKYTFIFKKKS